MINKINKCLDQTSCPTIPVCHFFIRFKNEPDLNTLICLKYSITMSSVLFIRFTHERVRQGNVYIIHFIGSLREFFG